MTENRLNLSELKAQTPAALLAMAEELEIENAPSMRKGEMMFSILKERGRPLTPATTDSRISMVRRSRS